MLSLVLGIAALACAVAPSFPGVTGVRWVLTTVGVSAVFTGTDALRRRRGRASLLITALATFGMGAGVIATVTMAATFFAATSGGALHLEPVAVPQSVVPNAASAAPSAPLPPVPAPAVIAPSIGRMEQTVGTLAFLMRRGHQAGTRWPAALQVSQGGVISAPDLPGVVLRLPVGTQLGYRTSTDGSAYAVRLSATGDPSRYVDFDTNSGVITASGSAGASPTS